MSPWWRRAIVVALVAISSGVWVVAHGDLRAGVLTVGVLLYFWSFGEALVLATVASVGTQVAVYGLHPTHVVIGLIVVVQGAALAWLLRVVAARGRFRHYLWWFALVTLSVVVAAALAAGVQAVFDQALAVASTSRTFGDEVARLFPPLLTSYLLTGFVVSLDWRGRGRQPLNGLAVAFLVAALGAGSIQFTTHYWSSDEAKSLATSAASAASAMSTAFIATVSNFESSTGITINGTTVGPAAIRQTLETLVHSEAEVDAIGYCPLGGGPNASYVIDQQGETRAFNDVMGFGPTDASQRRQVLQRKFFAVVGVRRLPSVNVAAENALVYLDVVRGPKGPLGFLSVALSLPQSLQVAQGSSGVAPHVALVLNSTAQSSVVMASSAPVTATMKMPANATSSLMMGTAPFTITALPQAGFGPSLQQRILTLGGETFFTLLLLAVALQSSQARQRSRDLIFERNELLNTALAQSEGVVAILNPFGRVVFSNATNGTDTVERWEETIPFTLSPADMALVTQSLALASEGQSENTTVVDTSSGVRPRYYEIGVRPLAITLEGAPLRLLRCVDVTEMRERDVRSAQFERLESLSSMARGLAHDFNNLLFIISGYLGQVLEDPSVPREGAIARSIEQAVEASKRGSEIADALLTVAGGRRLTVSSILVAGFLDRFVPMALRALGDEHHFVCTGAEVALAVHVDVGQLTSAVLNLVINARDASPIGSTITLSVRQQQDQLPSELSPGAYVVFQVSDEGTGVDPVIATRIFNPYFTTKPRGRGSGLDLATVLAFARQSGGTVELVNRPGSGATFNLYFPLVEMTSEVTAVDATVAPTVTRILVVDDEQPLGELVASWLNASGFEAHYESSPEAALQQVAVFAPQALVTDVELGGSIDGIELASRVLFQSPDIKIVFMAGYSGRMTTLQQRGMTVLAKPFRREELLAAFTSAETNEVGA